MRLPRTITFEPPRYSFTTSISFEVPRWRARLAVALVRVAELLVNAATRLVSTVRVSTP